jgi:hypothetical protein
VGVLCEINEGEERIGWKAVSVWRMGMECGMMIKKIEV